MKRRAADCVIGLVILLFAAFDLQAAKSGESALLLGDLFPSISGQTLTGRALELPRQAEGKPSVLVFSFSRTAAGDARAWNEALAKDSSASIAALAGPYAIIELESSPRLFRGAAVAGIRSGMPRAVQDRTIVLYKDGAVWEKRLGVADTRRAYVLLLDAGGHILWRNSSAMSATEYAQLKREIDGSFHSLAKRPAAGI